MTTPVVVPIQLGCCPDTPRCILCPPPPAPPSPELIDALVQNYAERPGPLEVRFFGGAPPTDTQIAAAGDLPIRVRVRPDLLTRAEASRLADRGVVGVELDVLTFHGPALREAGRRYRRPMLDEMHAGLPALGLEVGGVLAPGLPASTHAHAVEDARIAAAAWSTARIHPVLVLDESRLRREHEAERYTPLTLGQAVTTCHAMMDVLEGAGVTVVRVGLQPRADGYGRAVAGPHHSGLRELVEARRTLDALRGRMGEVPAGAVVTIRCAPADETRTRGMYNQNVRTLRAEHDLSQLRIDPDPHLSRGEHEIRIEEDHG